MEDENGASVSLQRALVDRRASTHSRVFPMDVLEKYKNNTRFSSFLNTDQTLISESLIRKLAFPPYIDFLGENHLDRALQGERNSIAYLEDLPENDRKILILSLNMLAEQEGLCESTRNAVKQLYRTLAPTNSPPLTASLQALGSPALFSHGSHTLFPAASSSASAASSSRETEFRLPPPM